MSPRLADNRAAKTMRMHVWDQSQDLEDARAASRFGAIVGFGALVVARMGIKRAAGA